MINIWLGITRFTVDGDVKSRDGWGVVLGFTIITPASADSADINDAYGSFVQLVVYLPGYAVRPKGFEWGELGGILSAIAHPMTVDLLSDGYFTEDKEANIQARIPNAIVRRHAIDADTPYEPKVVLNIERFWKRMDGVGAAAGRSGS